MNLRIAVLCLILVVVHLSGFCQDEAVIKTPMDLNNPGETELVDSLTLQKRTERNHQRLQKNQAIYRRTRTGSSPG